MKRLSSLILAIATLSSCASSTGIKKQAIQSISLYTMTNVPEIGTTLSGQKLRLGGFSGLQFTQENEGNLYFQTVTDRGPNGEPNGVDRPFLLPEYTPTIVVLKADTATKELTVSAEIKLKNMNGSPLSGLPNSRNGENPTDVFGHYYSIDPNGLDIEALAFDGEGGWWLAEEYGPSLVHFDPEGKMQKRLIPGVEIPRMYNQRKTNRGFEAVVFSQNKVFGFLQSPIPGDKLGSSEFSRVVEVDLETSKTSAEYFYPFNKGNDKIGDAVALDQKTILVLEQNGKIGNKSQKQIFKITLGESDQLVKKVLIADLKSTPFNDLEKIEGLALIDHKRIALVYDNDFQIAGHSNLVSGLTPLNESKNQLLVLEFKESLLENTQY